MEKINYRDKEIEVTESELGSIRGLLMIEGMISGLNGEKYDPKKIEEVRNECIEKVLKEREE